MREYPVTLNLVGKKVVIVGGGRIALRKLKGLLGCGANLKVVSPDIHIDIKKYVDSDNITLMERAVRECDLHNAFLIIVATNLYDVNEFVVKHAEDNQLVNASHQADRGNVSLPATLRRGRLVISVVTGGASPLLAKKIRDDLSLQYDQSYGQYVESLYKKRLEIKNNHMCESEKKDILEKAMNKTFL
ncbi:NAD(P)-dependent oxidoreductase [Anaerobacillus sp. 1_MG-2023]|uniref:NAD(P)-dependent oxidoreductase n=1 Tax=Bacillales TaxID=1385 RepID=UPI0026E2C8EC|nr:NAD(P)-dependent oxidoreductase [Anaerobacillus sp. 1_MG-2023]MDO6655088.1 NAD(P)-dependent oxidoreductase [Anaerobacillus sp. 1_MG-2023]